MSVSEFGYAVSRQIMAGLFQELKIEPGIHYHPQGHNAARVIILRLHGINPHWLKQIIPMREQLTMWAGLDDKSKIRIGHSQGALLVEIPKPKTYWEQVTIEVMEQRRMIRRGAIATLGMGLQDEPKRINFTEEGLAHVFITGQTRSGKTNAQLLLAWNLVYNTTPDETKLLIFDVAKRGYKWRGFTNVSHLATPIITDITTADTVLNWLNGEIERRAVNAQTTPRLFCVIDELKALIDDSDLASSYLARIASVGGEFGLHLILATQYPQIKMLGSAELPRNITTRLCGKVNDASAAANALGIPGSGAETLQGYGDFLLKDFDDLSRLTVAKIEPYHIEALPCGEANYLPVNSEALNPVRSIAQPKTIQRKMITPEELAIILHAWGKDHFIGLQKMKKLTLLSGKKLGGKDNTNEYRRRYAGQFIGAMQKLTAQDECVNFHDKSLREYGK